MDLQELVARIERWKARKEGGGRDIDEIIEESPVELQTSEAPDTLWQEHETGAEAEPSLAGAFGDEAEVVPESIEQIGEVVGEVAAEEVALVAEDVPVEEVPVEEDPVGELSEEKLEEVAVATESETTEGAAAEGEDTAADTEGSLDVVTEEEPVDSTTEIAVEEFEEIKE